MFVTIKMAVALLKKKKMQNLLVGTILVLMSTMLYIGLSMLNQTSPFEEMFQRANAAETVYVFTGSGEGIEASKSWWLSQKEVADVLLYNTLRTPLGYENNGKSESESAFITEFQVDSTLDKLYVTEDQLAVPPSGNEIYLNYNYAKNKRIALGDQVSIIYEGVSYSFVVKNFVVDPHFGNAFFSPDRCFVAPGFLEKNQMVANTPILAIKYKQFDAAVEKNLMKQYAKTIEDQAAPMSVNYDMFKMSYNIIISIIASMLLGISLFIIVIVIFVIRGTVRNMITQQYKSIGVKKVLGFTNKQIRDSFLFSYVIMGAFSALIGACVGIPIRNNIYAGIGYDMQVGLSAGMDSYMLFTVVIVIVLIGLFTVLATKETQKIKPVQALKYGMAEEKFSPNQFKIRNNNQVPLSLLMATKQMLMNKKKSMTIVLTMGILVYVALLINSMGNTLATSEHFAKYLVGTTIGDYSVANNSKQSTEEMIQHIQQLNQVTHVLFVDTHINEGTIGRDGDKITIGGQVFYGNTPDSFLVLTEGRKPQNNQEIVITNKLAEQAGKSVGDYMTIDTTKYLISGTMNSVILNQLCYIKLETIIPENISQENGYYWVYTDQKNVIIEEIQTQLEKQVPVGIIVSKYDSNITTILSTLEQFPAMVFTVLIVFAVVAGVVIINWTLMDISNMKRFFGVLKATGFSNGHITQMLIIKSMLLTFTGAIIGFILNVLTMNSVMTGIFKLSPFNTIKLPVLFDLKGSLLLMTLFLSIAFIATLLPSRKISTISPKQLIAQ